MLVHNFSGVGSNFAVVDLNGDGKPDIVTSGIYGTFVFMNHMKKGGKRTLTEIARADCVFGCKSSEAQSASYGSGKQNLS